MMRALLILTLLTMAGQADAFYIKLYGKVTEFGTGEAMKGVQVRLVKDSVERGTVITDNKGRYEVYLERGYDYLVWFHREDLITKHVRVDARDVPLFPDVPFYEMDMQMTMVHWIEAFDFSTFDEPVAMAEYKHSVRNLNWNIEWTEERQQVISRVMIEYDRIVAERNKAAAIAGTTARRKRKRDRAYF
ncbi:MAG TPA: hypothetical protein PK760_10940 [Flavobacteriales bacterium]|nr:hypothetical protein [Flavobacteriales bacterium]